TLRSKLQKVGKIELLDPEHQPHIAAVFYGLLMLLPQTEAFHTLQRRLACLPQALFSNVAHQNTPYQNGAGDSENRRAKLNFAALLKHFRSTQERHKISRHEKHKDLSANTPFEEKNGAPFPIWAKGKGKKTVTLAGRNFIFK
uniref:Vacuolar protein 14 C-terminal Fig4-binding domain-containing protein n=1 Tax=Romanomermis culicivorax TaxID=13658 RepID=A0A915IHY7_ROMCU